jgi:hypothetical protein
VLSVIDGPRFPLQHERHSLLPCLRNLSNSLRPSGPTARPRSFVEEPIWDRFKIIAAKRGMTIGAPAR